MYGRDWDCVMFKCENKDICKAVNVLCVGMTIRTVTVWCRFEHNECGGRVCIL